MSVRILHGDCRDVLATLPDASVQCCVTSPPYYGLREYGTATWEGGDLSCDHVVGELRTGLGLAKLGERYRGGGHKQAELGKVYAKGECPKCGALRIDKQIGLEPTPAEYVEQMIAVFREVRRVLRDDGTVWLNLGDSYAGGGGGNYSTGTRNNSGQNVTNVRNRPDWLESVGAKPKDLLGIPWRVAFALQADGWWLRSDIIWAKPNPMPESVTDRPTSAHEHVFLLTKREKYFFDAEAVREQCESGPSDIRKMVESLPRIGGKHKDLVDPLARASSTTNMGQKRSVGDPSGRNVRNVWTIATSPYPDAHFATFPPELAERCIKAGSSERGCCAKCGAPWMRITTKGEPDRAHQLACGGDASGEYHGQSIKGHDAAGVQNASDVKRRILDGLRKKTFDWKPSCSCDADVIPCTVLDPFGGAGTTGVVADSLNRSAILIELNPTYAALADRRIHGPLFAGMAAQ